jgi:GT2 family glycosyltransferase
MLDEIGYYDGDFFIYCEDTDLGLRGVLAGWKGLLARDAVIYHKYSLTCGALSPFKLYLVERNHYWMAIRNLPPSMLLLLPFYTVVRFFEQARCLVSAKGTGAEFMVSPSKTGCVFAILKAVFHAMAGIPGALAKRKVTMARKKISNQEFRTILKQYRLSFRDLLDAG